MENTPTITEVMDGLNGALSISEVSRRRHEDTEKLHKERALALDGGYSSDDLITQRQKSLSSQISAVQARVMRLQEDHIKKIGSYGTLAHLDGYQQVLLGKLRALDKVVDHHRALRTELLGDSSSIELDEAKCMKRYASSKQNNAISNQQIKEMEDETQRLIEDRNRPYPSQTDLGILERECLQLDAQIASLESQISTTLALNKTSEPLRDEALKVVNELIHQLSIASNNYSKVCDLKMEQFSYLVDVHEKKLKLYRLEREYVDEFGETNVHIDFESRDLEYDKHRLNRMHANIKALNGYREICESRIDELKHILTSAPLS